MSDRRVPRGLVVAVAALIVSLPAALAVAGVYRLTPVSELVIHRHVSDYWTLNAVNGDDQLKSRVNQARLAWNEGLTTRNAARRPSAADGVRIPAAPAGTAAEIRLSDDYLGDNEAAIVAQSFGYHAPDRAQITFNRTRTNAWTGDEKQSRACNVLGNALGLDDGFADRNDCMALPGIRVGVGSLSLDQLQSFYGPDISLSGSLHTQRDDLKATRPYTLSASASGHAMNSIEILLDGERKAYTENPACSEKCTRAATWTVDGEDLMDGEHEVEVVARNALGDTDRSTFPILVSAHTGILPHYTLESEQLWDRGAVQVNVVNGNLVVEQNDLEIAGTTLDLGISRYYNSLTDRPTELGPRWSFDTGSGIEIKTLSGGNVRFFGPSGYAVRFKKTGSAYTTPTGIDATLTDRSGGGWNLDLLKSEERYVFDAQGRFIEHLNEKSDQKISFAYDGSTDRLTMVTDTQEREINFAHWTQADASAGLAPLAAVGQLRSITTPTVETVSLGQRQTKWHYFYDSVGRLSRAYVEDDPGSDAEQTRYGDIEYRYNAAGRLAEIIDPKGIPTRILYEGETGKVSQLIRPASTGEADQTPAGYATSFDYRDDHTSPCDPEPDDNDWEKTIVTAPRGNETEAAGDYDTTYCHDAESRVKQIFDAKDQRQELDYSSKSNVISHTSGAGADTELKHEGDRLTRISEAGGAVTTLQYSATNSTSFNPTSITGPQGNATTTSTTDHKLQFEYQNQASATGNVERIKDGAGATLIELDYFEEGEQSMADPDWEGLLESSTDGEGHKTTYHYDGAGNLTKEVPPGSGLQGDTQYEYDALSRVTKVTDANGVPRTIEYDALGRPLNTRYPAQQLDGDSVRLVYDPNGNLVQRTDGRQNEGRSDQRDEFTYNLRNLRTIDKLRDDREIRYAYDPNANLTDLRYVGVGASDVITTYEYDQLDLVAKITEPAAAGTARPPFEFIYRGDNQLDRVNLPNGVVQRFAYITVPDPNDDDKDGNREEATGDLRSIRAFAPGENPDTGTPSLLNLIYDYDSGTTYDPNTTSDHSGVIQRVRDLASSPNLTTEYDYDDLGRIDKVKEDGAVRYDYDYDYDSNLTRSDERGTVTNYAYNAVHEITEINGTPTGSYDANGNLLSLKGQTYSYDQRSRTRSVDPPGTPPALPFDYSDESQAERWIKGETEFWDTLLGTSVEDPPSSGEDRIYYTRSPQGQALSMLRNLGSRTGDHYPLVDSLGSTVALTDHQGALVTRYRYEPYGEQLGAPSGPQMPWRFAGQYLDQETGLYKMGVRYYDPQTMRWTQKDPLNLFQDPKQGNRYSYAGADPVNNVDPSGMQSLACYEQQRDLWRDGWGLGGTPGMSCPSGGSGQLTPVEEACLEGAGRGAVRGSIWESWKAGKLRPPTPLNLVGGCIGGSVLELLGF